jgi:hypothetical protein
VAVSGGTTFDVLVGVLNRAAPIVWSHESATLGFARGELLAGELTPSTTGNLFFRRFVTLNTDSIEGGAKGILRGCFADRTVPFVVMPGDADGEVFSCLHKWSGG